MNCTRPECQTTAGCAHRSPHGAFCWFPGGMDNSGVDEARQRKLESVAKAIFWEMNAVMHDHEECWRTCGKQALYRDCARAAIVAAAHFGDGE